MLSAVGRVACSRPLATRSSALGPSTMARRPREGPPARAVRSRSSPRRFSPGKKSGDRGDRVTASPYRVCVYGDALGPIGKPRHHLSPVTSAYGGGNQGRPRLVLGARVQPEISKTVVSLCSSRLVSFPPSMRKAPKATSAR